MDPGWTDVRGPWIALGVSFLLVLAIAGVVWLAGGCTAVMR